MEYKVVNVRRDKKSAFSGRAILFKRIGNFLNISAIYINIWDEVCKITAFLFLFPWCCYN
jgi:hypothetical protein